MSYRSAPTLGEDQHSSMHTTVQSMLPLVSKKTKMYRDNREPVLEILQAAVAVLGSVDGLLPVGGAIISKVLQSIQVKS
jgi:hypothetical protein